MKTYHEQCSLAQRKVLRLSPCRTQCKLSWCPWISRTWAYWLHHTIQILYGPILHLFVVLLHATTSFRGAKFILACWVEHFPPRDSQHWIAKCVKRKRPKCILNCPLNESNWHTVFCLSLHIWSDRYLDSLTLRDHVINRRFIKEAYFPTPKHFFLFLPSPINSTHWQSNRMRCQLQCWWAFCLTSQSRLFLCGRSTETVCGFAHRQ